MFRAVFVKVALLISLVFVSTIQAEENPLIRVGGELIGVLGVSGAPGGRADEDCAVKGLATIKDDLDF